MTQPTRTRRGFTLLELLVVMSILTILLAILSLLLSAMLQTQRQSLLRDRQRQEYFRLDTILRADGHAATTVNLRSPTDCELKNASGQRWTYRAEESGLVRERFQGEQRAQREVFYLRPGTQVKFGTPREHNRQLLQLDLDLPAQSGKFAAHQASYRALILVGGAVPGEQRPAAEGQP